MSKLFEKRNLKYNLRLQTNVSLYSESTIVCGLKSMKYFARKVWNIVPFEIRNSISLEEFSAKINTWTPENCPCRVCLSYIHQGGCI